MTGGEITNWRAVKVPTHTWEVHADAFDTEGAHVDILLGSWLTEDTARLIAAAPDLYAALANLCIKIEEWETAVRKIIDRDPKHGMDLTEARAALAKADGPAMIEARTGE